MRILQIVQKPQRRGAEVFAFQLSRELRRQGHTVQIAYLYPHMAAGGLPVEAPDCVLDGQERHPFEVVPGVHPSLLGSVLNAIDEFGPHVVQVNGSRTVKYGALATFLRGRRSWKLVYRNIGNPRDWVRTPLHRAYYRRLIMPRLDGIVGVSRTTLEIVREFYRLSTPMVAIPRGVDPSLLTPTLSRQDVRQLTDTPPEAPVIVYVGSLTPEKRLDRLVRLGSWLTNKYPDLRVWLVGEGSQRSLLEEQVQAEGMSGRVQFLGVQTNVADYLQAADVFVLTSDTEGIPGVLLEAGYMGLPVVATRVGGVGECVIDGETGLLAEREDEAGLAAAVERLLGDAGERARMGAAARRWIEGRFTMDVVAGQYVAFYERLLRETVQVQTEVDDGAQHDGI